MLKCLIHIPFVSKACESAGFIFVDNTSPISARKVIQEAEKHLRKGISIFVFLEGCRSKTGRMGSFKNGTFQIALDLNIPIVPATVNGSFDVMPMYSYLINPHAIELVIHIPIFIEDMKDYPVNTRFLASKSKEIIESKLWKKYK